MKSEYKFNLFHYKKHIWKCLQNVNHFVQASFCIHFYHPRPQGDNVFTLCVCDTVCLSVCLCLSRCLSGRFNYEGLVPHKPYFSGTLLGISSFVYIFSATTPATCPPGQFRCNNGQCIQYQFVCNKNPDCADASDEQHCSKWRGTISGCFCELQHPLMFQCPGPHLSIKTIFPRYGDPHVKDKMVVRPAYL